MPGLRGSPAGVAACASQRLIARCSIGSSVDALRVEIDHILLRPARPSPECRACFTPCFSSDDARPTSHAWTVRSLGSPAASTTLSLPAERVVIEHLLRVTPAADVIGRLVQRLAGDRSSSTPGAAGCLVLVLGARLPRHVRVPVLRLGPDHPTRRGEDVRAICGYQTCAA